MRKFPNARRRAGAWAAETRYLHLSIADRMGGKARRCKAADRRRPFATRRSNKGCKYLVRACAAPAPATEAFRFLRSCGARAGAMGAPRQRNWRRGRSPPHPQTGRTHRLYVKRGQWAPLLLGGKRQIGDERAGSLRARALDLRQLSFPSPGIRDPSPRVFYRSNESRSQADARVMRRPAAGGPPAATRRADEMRRRAPRGRAGVRARKTAIGRAARPRPSP